MASSTKPHHSGHAKAAAADYQLVLYRRALHPELFNMKARRTIRSHDGELEAWLMTGSHLLRFRHEAHCACELVIDRDDQLPTAGAVAMFPCSSERDYEHLFTDAVETDPGAPSVVPVLPATRGPGGVRYMTTVQTETLSGSLFAATYQEINSLSDSPDALVVRWAEPTTSHSGPGGGACISLLEFDKYPGEIHTHAYHLIASAGLVVRTESIFEFGPRRA
ncbi:MAG: hypothetical protein ACT4PL_07525 [Phycisphaerales bacterium]